MLISVLRMCFYFFVIYLEVPKFYLIFAHEYKFNPQVFYIFKGKKTLIK